MTKKNGFCVQILAGGLGTRMKSELPKVLHEAAGIPIIGHILRAADAIKPEAIGVIVGHKAGLARQAVETGSAKWGITAPVEIFLQQQLTGSGRAVQEAMPFIGRFSEVLILCGDTPLLTAPLLDGFYAAFAGSGAAAAILTAQVPDPHGYGRIVKDRDGFITAIVEQTETDAETARITEINSGMYIFRTEALKTVINRLEPNGPKREFYLTDAVRLLAGAGLKIAAVPAPDREFILGVNSRLQLAEAEQLLRARKLRELMADGVTVKNPAATYIDEGVSIGRDSVVFPGTHICGGTVIGKNCMIGPNCHITDCELADGVEIKFSSVLLESRIGQGCSIGPFSHIRPGCELAQNAHVGNFSELKKAKIGAGSKVNHLSYIGDAEIGSGVNIGAGTITCNYDGVGKHKTVLGDRVFVGSNTNLVAPVTVAEGAHIAAGSTITDDVPAEALAIARARQVVKEGRYKKRP
ncbi:MAG: bifunctional UDP-N-acetylglucosamine diphosphorylase/glucosamine-1-phosphate N-acetyltransferase GlmU [Elusimicrobiaceae bacterium]|nr:bifunctional UDP-N-acetylglucosamine diphosphorylase/glucosamine-1-phosphate N-acetyltransferase GlmU [Elusimicrobiaceae bacterium]